MTTNRTGPASAVFASPFPEHEWVDKISALNVSDNNLNVFIDLFQRIWHSSSQYVLVM
ncbi:hypothetical protein YPPY66_1642 [Yersinia pestis PY-66]|uniref:Uncharacterized protein n=3 Tax=Yersinia pestis TaxID=632 RepID=Q8CKS1_YERPE|nr:hypothetical protein [Yersinia pestis]AAM86514.1 hypothetical [Yersinia pestis KIM10+]AAS61170.1 hypothetical protein YP_0914 [Yersinia pestis biovar Microtus str. 91001]ABG12908.1 conserved hypothetical protein [Yersinia pestis Antiqua]ABG19079.1 conserved hypothetical protein [Yersinia pestis Nepal516]ADV99503.1 hypothetical protein YPC_2978 [Yersinia pestis biovar Medievalis str. Harbin 35]EEO81685.1 hypothetical protein YPF_1656 [Yersinia pestis biovar Orientalis str. India 195]EEO875